MRQQFDQIGRHGGGGGGGAVQWDIIGRAFAQADRVGGPVAFDQVGQRGGGAGGGGMRGGGFRGGGFRGGFRGGRVVRTNAFRAVDVVPWFPWWGTGWWGYPAAYANSVYTAYPQQFADACTALGRAEAQGAPAETLTALRAQCAQLVYAQQQPAAVAAPAYGYGYGYRGAWPFGTPGYLAY